MIVSIISAFLVSIGFVGSGYFELWRREESRLLWLKMN